MPHLDDIRTELTQTWDLTAFNKSRLPAMLGKTCDPQALDVPAKLNAKLKTPTLENMVIQSSPIEVSFYDDGLYIEDMPIKFPQQPYHVPASVWANFGKVLTQVLEAEKAVNPDWDDCYIYLTIQQSHVAPNTAQRRGGIHVDGFQKASIVPQTIQHQIALTNTIPTIFYKKAIEPGQLSDSKKQFFADLHAQCIDAPTFEPAPYNLHLLNAYCPHQTGVATKAEYRTFIRLSASKIPFMGQDNTRNPLIDYEWNEDKKKTFYESIAKA